MPIGAGACPVGASSAGYGVPDKAATPGNATLPDIRTGFPQSGRAINPTTKSPYFTTDGRLVGMATVPQLVQIALTTIRGSAAIATLGQTFSQIQEKGADFQQRVTNAVNLALADLVKQNLVQVVSVTVDTYPTNTNAGLCRVKWVDLTNGTVNTNNVGP